MDQGFGAPYGCWCTNCQALFEQQFGRPMPKGITWDEDWEQMLEFRYQASDRFEQALFAHIKALNPPHAIATVVPVQIKDAPDVTTPPAS